MAQQIPQGATLPRQPTPPQPHPQERGRGRVIQRQRNSDCPARARSHSPFVINRAGDREDRGRSVSPHPAPPPSQGHGEGPASGPINGPPARGRRGSLPSRMLRARSCSPVPRVNNGTVLKDRNGPSPLGQEPSVGTPADNKIFVRGGQEFTPENYGLRAVVVSTPLLNTTTAMKFLLRKFFEVRGVAMGL